MNRSSSLSFRHLAVPTLVAGAGAFLLAASDSIADGCYNTTLAFCCGPNDLVTHCVQQGPGGGAWDCDNDIERSDQYEYIVEDDASWDHPTDDFHVTYADVRCEYYPAICGQFMNDCIGFETELEVRYCVDIAPNTLLHNCP
jgi:hypothetical protein